MQIKQQKLYGLDHLRFIAITLVFLYHYRMGIYGQPPWLRDVAKFGWTGVDLFFVLSGFLIASQLFTEIRTKNSISFRSFFIKRFFRIIPAYWFVLLIYFCWPAFREREFLPPLWKFITFTQNFGLDIKAAGTFSHAWSLCVEEHFYLLLPLTLILLLTTGLFKRAYILLIVLFITGFFLRNFSWQHFYFPFMEEKGSWLSWYKFVYYPSYNRLDGLLIGVSIAALCNFRPAWWERIAKFHVLFLVAGIGILTCAYFLCYEEHAYEASVYGFPLIALGYGFLVIAAISPANFLFKWNSRVTTFIAMLSYGIYLSHKGIIFIVQNYLSEYGVDKDSNLMLLICSAASILAALIMYLAIERPFMKLRNKLV